MSHTTVAGGSTLNPAEHTDAEASLLHACRARAKGAKIPDGAIAAALTEYRAGASMTDLSLKYAISRNYLYDHATRAGIRKIVRVPPGDPSFPEAPYAEPPQKEAIAAHPVRYRRPADTWAAIRRDYLAGYPAAACAERYGVAEATIRDHAKKEGWRRKDRVVAPLQAPADPGQVVVDADGLEQSRWSEIAHEAQRPPAGRWNTWLLQGGRGAGKTRAGAEWLMQRALARERGRFALIGATLNDVREVMIDGPSGLRNLPGRERPVYEVSRRRLLWGNGAEAHAFSAEEPERLRGPQFEAAWADEFCTWANGDYTLMLLRMGLRLGRAPQLVVTTTPKPIPALRRLRAEASCVVTQAPTSVNAANLTESFLQNLHALYVNTRFVAQELEGVMLEGEGALFRHADLVAARGRGPDRFERVIVAVDPPAGSEGAACGIVVAARAAGHGYVLADHTRHGLSPLGWATVVAEAARAFGAAEIVAEANQGGEMVRSVLALGGASCPVRLVHATLSKRTRAEPVAALYEQRRVTHVAAFPHLEEELMALGVADAEGRLDRADALVWALHTLLVEAAPESPRMRPL